MLQDSKGGDKMRIPVIKGQRAHREAVTAVAWTSGVCVLVCVCWSGGCVFVRVCGCVCVCVWLIAWRSLPLHGFQVCVCLCVCVC